MRDLKQSLTQGKDFSGETINYKKDGSPYHVEWRISAIRDFSGNILCFISIQRDITEKVKKENPLQDTSVWKWESPRLHKFFSLLQ